LLISNSISARRRLTSSGLLLYGISDRSQFPGISLQTYLGLLVSSRAQLLQWREKDLSLKESLPLIREGIRLTHLEGKLFFVNSLVEVALQENADGVHLPGHLSVSHAISLRSQSGRKDFIIGKSVHSVEEGILAEKEGADYVFLSPIFPPRSKKSETPPLGLSGFRKAIRLIHIPVFALGGIKQSHFEVLLDAGAAGVAGISWFHEELGAKLRHLPREGIFE